MAVAQVERPLSERLAEQAEQLEAAIATARDELGLLRGRLPGLEQAALDAEAEQLAGEPARDEDVAGQLERTRARVSELDDQVERQGALLDRVRERGRRAENDALKAEQEELAVRWEQARERAAMAAQAHREAGLELLELHERDVALADRRAAIDPDRPEGYLNSRHYRRLEQVAGWPPQRLSPVELDRLVQLTEQQALRVPPAEG